MDWLKAFYGAVGANYPLLSLIVVMLIGGLASGAVWWVVGEQYRKDRPAISFKTEQPTPMRPSTRMANTNITSHNQSGGFTGINQGTVNLGPHPRSISPDARARLINGLKKAPNSFIGIDTPFGDTEAQNFADELKKAFEEAGWKVAVVQAGWEHTPTGLHLAFHSSTDVPAHAAILQEALLDAGFVAPADGVDLNANEHTVRLIVGTKPKG